ncbi:peptidase M61 domain-containing protein, partial [mine drainage metagenome]
PLNTLVDSPVITGSYFRQINLAPGNPVHRYLDIVADYPEALNLTRREIQDYRHLIVQESRMFHSHHYAAYHFLLTLSNHTSHFGLEHHQSSDDRTNADYFLNPEALLVGADLLPHEYTHSWNGKFRRPARLWQPNFQIPEQTGLLWVYEGLTQYWGDVMATRSEIWTPRDFREAIAMTAANMSHRPGRDWRPLQDTATAAPYLYYAPGFYATFRRSVDFYPEGELIWLEVDTKIRMLSHGTRSLNDFARLFFGMDNGSDVTRTYDMADVVRALKTVEPYHWGRFLRKRLDRVGHRAPLSGLRWGGWRLVYTAHPSPYTRAMQ